MGGKNRKPRKRNNIQKQMEVNGISKEKNKQYIFLYLKRQSEDEGSKCTSVRTE